MKIAKTVLALAISSVSLMHSVNANAWDLTSGDKLSITSGSFFGVDVNGDSKLQLSEKTAMSLGSAGIVIGASGGVTAPWTYLGESGYDWLSTPIPAASSGFSNIGGVDMSGWMVTWNGQNISLGTGAWQVQPPSSGMPNSGYTDGIGIFNWSGVYGGSYTLDYTATVQSGPFQNIQWALHLAGTVAPVPEASTYGMMLAGLGLVGVATRRKKPGKV